MDYPKMPELVTPELVNTLVQNAGALKDLLSSGDEVTAMDKKHDGDTTCCCPLFLKFKFILCNVWIFNENA
ncbi:MAG: hypothetical protein GX755_02400, partial [Syntrophomonadaceae bacterium]|nr:hypothetical protein [Syntrophomonadaceae bacterium]